MLQIVLAYMYFGQILKGSSDKILQISFILNDIILSLWLQKALE